jgi:hypothetical protein
MNKKHPNNLVAIAGMIILWNGLKETLPFFSKLCNLIGYYKVFCKKKKKEGRMLENLVKSQLNTT